MSHTVTNLLWMLLRLSVAFAGGLLTHSTAAERDAPLLCIDSSGHSARVTRILFDPADTNRLFSVGEDKVIRVWDVQKGTSHTLRGQVGAGKSGELYAAALSPDGKTLAVGGRDKDIRLFDIASGRVVHRLTGHSDVITDLAYAPNGILASSSADLTIRLWDIPGERTRILTGHTAPIYGVAFTPDSLLLASAGDDKTVRVWDARTEKETKRFECRDRVRRPVWSPDGQTLAVGSETGLVTLWERGNAYKRRAFQQPETVTCLAFDGNERLLTGSVRQKDGTATARVWSLADGKPLRQGSPHRADIMTLACDKSGKIAASADVQGVIQVWNTETGAKVATLAGEGQSVGAVAWARDGTPQVAWGGGYDAAAPALTHTFHFGEGIPGADVTDAAVWQKAQTTRAGKTLVIAADRAAVEIQENGKTLGRVGDKRRSPFDDIQCMTWTPRGDIVIGSNFSLWMYDAAGRPLHEFTGHTGVVRAVSVSPDGTRLASGSDDQTLRVWNLPLARAPMPAFSGGNSPSTPLEKPGNSLPLLSLFTGTSGEWVLWTQEGYYACSPNGDSLIGWQVNRGEENAADYYTAYQYRVLFYRPDIVRNVVGAGTVAEAMRLAQQDRPNRPTTPAETATVEKALEQAPPPLVSFTAPRDKEILTTDQVAVVGAVTDPHQRKIKSVTLYVNGRLVRNLEVQAGGTDVWRRTVPLTPGENILTLRAVNEAGAESAPVSVRVFYRGAAVTDKPVLYVLALGVSKYQKEELSLRYSAKDAIDLSRYCTAQEGRLFSRVETKVLTDEKANKGDILDALEWLSKKQTARDWALVFVSGHGVCDNLNQYYYAPYDVDPARLKRTGVVWTDFRTTLANLPGKVLLVLDTCHAGSASRAGAFGGTRAATAVALTDLLRDAANDAGLITLASCLPDQVSVENEAWQNGAFTRALIEGLEGKADLNGDGIVTMAELNLYVSERVKQLTNGQQRPTTNKSSVIPDDMPLAILR